MSTSLLHQSLVSRLLYPGLQVRLGFADFAGSAGLAGSKGLCGVKKGFAGQARFPGRAQCDSLQFQSTMGNFSELGLVFPKITRDDGPIAVGWRPSKHGLFQDRSMVSIIKYTVIIL
jgi:hypothetical protein